MQTARTYSQYEHLLALPAARAGVLDYIRAGSLAVWFFSLIVRYWWLSDWFALQEEFQSGVNIKLYYLVGFLIACAAHLTLGLGAWFALPFNVLSTWSGKLFTTFCVVALVSSPLSLAPKGSAVYSVATWAVFALLCLYWQSDYRAVRRMIVFAGIVVLGWVYVMLLRHGLTFGAGGGFIGGMNRNTTALAALGGAVCCSMSTNKWLRWSAIAAGLAIAVMVTSRGTIVATGAFLVTYYFLTKGSIRLAAYGLGAALVVLFIFLASPAIREFVFEDVMRLHDEHRGMGSGFTGRVEFWKQAIDSFWEKPVFGHGFRATAAGGRGDYGAIHSGYLKLLVETGFVGAVFVISAVVIELFKRMRLALQFRNLAADSVPGIDVVETARVNTVACATIALTMTMWIYEQLYINLGSVISVLFFLMMAAPAYITTQGIGLRR